MSDVSGVAAAVDELDRHVDRYAEQGNAEAILSPDVSAVADRIRALTAPDGLTAHAALALARFHWCRYLALPEGEDDADQSLAIELFTALWHIDPEVVPAPVRALLEQGSDGPGTAHNDHGVGLFAHYERTGDSEALDVALAAFEAAVTACQAGDPQLRRYLSNLAGAHLARFGERGAGSDLDEAIAIGLRAAGLDGGDERSRAATMGNLAVALRTRFEYTERLSDLDESIACERAALGILSAGHPDTNAYLAGLANGLRLRFAATGQRHDLDEAIVSARQAVDTAVPGDPDLPVYLGSLASCALTRFERYDDQDDVDLAVDAGQAAVERAPPGHQSRLGCLTNLGNALRERYVRTASLDDLAAGVRAAGLAVAEVPAHHPIRPSLLSNLAALLRTQASRTGDAALLDRAVAIAAEAASSPDARNRGMISANFAVALLTRFESRGDPADLDAAIVAAGTAVDAAAPESRERAARRSELGVALMSRYTSRGDSGDLDTALQHTHQAVAAARPDHPDLGRHLSNLAYILRIRAAVTDDRADFDAAVRAGEEAVTWLAADRPERAGYLVNLSSALAARFQRYGDDGDIDAAVANSREAAARTPDDHADLPGRWNNLALVLRVRFERTGRLAELDESVLFGRRAVDALPAGHADRPAHLTNLSGALRVRFQRTGERSDLDAAVDAARAAATELPAAHTQRGGFLSNLSNALRARFDESSMADDLEDALAAAAEAVELTPPGTDRAQYLSNLSAALLSVVEHTPTDTAKLDAAIDSAREAVVTSPDDHPERGRYLINLGNALITRGRPADLEEAVSLTAEAVRTTPADHPDRAGFLFTAGHAQHLLHPETGVPGVWREAAQDRTGSAEVRLRTAWAWATTAATGGDVEDAVRGFTAAVRLLPVVAWRGLGDAVRERQLRQWSGLAGDACAWALRAGRPKLAVELLEQGRSIMWNQIAQIRTDLSDARAAAPELVERLTELRAALDAPAAPPPVPGIDGPDGDQRVLVQRRLAQEWDDIITRIRGIDGLHDFLAAVPYDDLAAEAEDGPIIMINTSRYGSAAILVTPAEPLVVNLPALTRTETVERINAMLQSRLAAQTDRSFANLRAAHRTLLDVLAWLFDTVAEPILDTLGDVTGPRDGTAPPRVWWCPTGPLTLLPLHAAGRPGTGHHDTVLDRVVSSYLPTLGTLHRARAGGGGTSSKVLLVDQPATPGQAPLPFAAEEARRLTARLHPTTTLSGPRATGDVVLDHLAGHGWAHLCCHGEQDPAEPGRSALHLHDRPLSVAEISRHRFPYGQLAYLSACETSTGGVRLLDEAMHLSCAFQTAGFRHVIATLWTVHDDRSAQLADDVYAQLLASGRLDAAGAARALHRAVLTLREQLPHAPLVWAPYVHSGP
ncbi:CHAT domain-containing protein [Plantactinospora soyae]|uniref:Tetratricopeptide (TPR) repeat protein n=1 Tax=Plantactinospora soyae TaxID=1544732 RepID=A0A927MCB1_9ACTN|nr:CHAT domain-containing protein [Plantactinospora soyae]MBE1489173.1 tetratricopeptide (TPR) repeat protein [Plantactinospora soyae]